MTTSTWILIGALFIMVLLQLGEKKFNFTRTILLPIVIVAYFSYKYIDGLPTGGYNTIILAIMIIGGIIFGLLTLFFSDTYFKKGSKFIKVGIPYLILWIIALGFKIISVEYMTKWNITGTGEFIMKHHINPTIISTSFMIFTILMIAIRIIGVLLKFYIFPKKEKSIA